MQYHRIIWSLKAQHSIIIDISHIIMRRNIIRLHIASLLTIFLLSSCGPTTVSQIEEKYNGAQVPPEKVLQLVESNTMLFESFYEDSYFYFDRSGRVYGVDINNDKDIGKWDVSESGELCMKLQHWWFGPC